MAKTIVFFNLADMHGAGLAQKSVNSLRKKYPSYSFIYELFHGANRIIQVDLFGLLKEMRKPTGKHIGKSGIPLTPINMITGHIASLPPLSRDTIREKLAITMLCGQADKIMLGVHGHYDDTDYGYAGMGWEKGDAMIGSHEEFAKLIAGFLRKDKTYKIALIVCFGARSQNYRKNHDGELTEEDIKSSFAYKFYKNICTKANVIMTARTGSVAFSDINGKSQVQTETAVEAEIEYSDLLKVDTIDRMQKEYNELLERIFDKEGKIGVDNVKILKDRIERNQPVEGDPHILLFLQNYVREEAKARHLHATKETMQEKYGKFVYRYEKGIVTVYRKYEGGQKVMRVLYSGEL